MSAAEQELGEKDRRKLRQKIAALPRNTDLSNLGYAPQELKALREGMQYPQLEIETVDNAETLRLPKNGKEWIVLGIETSCDDTAAAVVCSDGRILGESVAKQDELNDLYGGVKPGAARDAHAQHIEATISNALEQAAISVEQLDAVAVTMGPGLELCLRVGFHAASALAVQHGIPFLSVHHLEAHCLVANMFRLASRQQEDPRAVAEDAFQEQAPAIVLLVSGGHCQLIRRDRQGHYEVYGGTVDDSIGEAFDKVARLLQLDVAGCGGGPAVERLAAEWALEGKASSLVFPIPMRKYRNCNMSYAGLKTAVRLAVEKGSFDKGEIAFAFQAAAVKHLMERTARAIEWSKSGAVDSGDHVRELTVCGGVASNQQLRSALQDIAQKHALDLVVPPVKYCTDNGVMIAWAAIEKIERYGLHTLQVDPRGLEVRARWPLGKYVGPGR